MPPGKLINIVVISFCLAFSALYELMEWLAAMIVGKGADDFLGTQGDVWDTQWDVFMALVAALAAVFLVRPLLDRVSAPSIRSESPEMKRRES